MSDDQRDAANRVARELAGAAVDAGAPPPPAEAAGGEKKREVPLVRLPCEGWGDHRFQTEVGQILKTNGIFRRENIPVVINPETGRVETMTVQRFRTYCVKSMKTARFLYTKEGSFEGSVEKTMTSEHAKACLESDFFIDQQRPISRVNLVRMPVLRHNGRVELLSEGYDPESKTYTVPSAVKIDETMALEKAVSIINDLLAEFPFGDYKEDTPENRAAGTVGQSRSKAVHLAAMLSLYGAGLIGETVKKLNFVYTANRPRSGKSLLAEMAIIPVCGLAKVKPKPESSEELRKVLDSTAIGAAPYLFLDDLDGLLKSNDLNAFMTALVWSGRHMGAQAEFAVPKHAIVFITGNNLRLTTDIANRTLRCNLYTEEFDAQNRMIKRVIDEEYLVRPEVRGAILSALWTFIREWDNAKPLGRPKGRRVLRGFERWSEVFGGIVANAGFGDPLEAPPADDHSGDTETADMQTLVRALVDDMETRPSTLGPDDEWTAPRKKEFRFEELVECANANDAFQWMMDGSKKRDKDGNEWIELNQRSKSALGIMFSAKFGGQKFRLPDGRAVKFGNRGRNRHRKYMVELVG